MPTDNYPPSVARLLELGRLPLDQDGFSYRALGLSETDVPQLCRLAQDHSRHDQAVDDPQAYASLHAWRALGELRAEAAIDTLIGELRHADRDDWMTEELPAILGKIGPAAIPALTVYLGDACQGTGSRAMAMSSLSAIAHGFPESRGRCVASVSAELSRFAEQDAEFNAMLIGELCVLVAVEAAPLIEQAFTAGAVELSIVGDWEDVQIDLGLLPRRLASAPDYWENPEKPLPWHPRSPFALQKNVAAKARKAKRKQQTKSRKGNRKKK